MLSYAVYVVRRYGVERNRNCSMKYCGYISAVDAVLEGVGGWGAVGVGGWECVSVGGCGWGGVFIAEFSLRGQGATGSVIHPNRSLKEQGVICKLVFNCCLVIYIPHFKLNKLFSCFAWGFVFQLIAPRYVAGSLMALILPSGWVRLI